MAAFCPLKVTIASKQGGGVYSTIQTFSNEGSYAEVVDINYPIEHSHS